MIPNLGDIPLDQQRDRLLAFYASQGLIDPEQPEYCTDQPRADISRMRHTALGPYIDTVTERMRKGALADFVVPGDSIEASSLFEMIQEIDGQTRPSLLVRRINRFRLELARQTGTDRDGSASPTGDQYEYEQQVMKEYAISSPRDITYAAIYRPSSGAIRVNNHNALLVYAPEGLQQVTPRYKDFSSTAVFGLHVFLDQRLMSSSLLATVENDQPSPHPANFGGIALGTQLVFPSAK